MNKVTRQRICLLSISMAMACCTFVIEQPLYDIDLPHADDKLQFPVCLILTEDLLQATLKDKDNIVPLGKNLAYNIETLMRNVFADVTVAYNGNSDRSTLAGADVYFMIPEMVSAAYRWPVWWPFEDTKTTIAVEWKLTKKTGETVWIETISGTHTGRMKNDYNVYFIKETLDDLLRRSQEELLSSKILRNLP